MRTTNMLGPSAIASVLIVMILLFLRIGMKNRSNEADLNGYLIIAFGLLAFISAVSHTVLTP